MQEIASRYPTINASVRNDGFYLRRQSPIAIRLAHKKGH